MKYNRIFLALFGLFVLAGMLFTAFGYGVYITEYDKPLYRDIRAAYQKFSDYTSRYLGKRIEGLTGERVSRYGTGNKDNKMTKGLGYVQGVETNKRATGVVIHDTETSWKGLNLYVSGHRPSAHLMTMDGTVLHRWKRDWSSVFSEQPASDRTNYWRRVHVFPNGDILAIYERLGIVKLNSKSEIIWKNNRIKTHHDLDVDSRGRTWVISSKSKPLPGLTQNSEYSDDAITLLSKKGDVVERYSIWEAIRSSEYSGLAEYVDGRKYDILHINTLRIIDQEESEAINHPAFQEGNVILSARNLNALMIFDPEKESIVWAEAGLTKGQHEPIVTKAGNLLVFDNYWKTGKKGSRSRLIEFSPSSGFITWEYKGEGLEWFGSGCCGTNQELPNGNILIAETAGARAIEITKDRELSWVFHNPHSIPSEPEKRGSLFSIHRYKYDFFNDSFLDEPSGK